MTDGDVPEGNAMSENPNPKKESGENAKIEETKIEEVKIEESIDEESSEEKMHVNKRKKSRSSETGGGVTALGKLKLKASTPGTWGNKLSVRVDREGINEEVAKKFGLSVEDIFNLTVFKDDVKKEIISNVSVREGIRRVDRVLREESALIRVQDPLPEGPPQDTTTGPVALTGGFDSDPLDSKDYMGNEAGKEGIYALEKTDLFNILCIPPDKRDEDIPRDVYAAANAYCVKRRSMLIVDPPAAWGKVKETAASKAKEGFNELGLSGIDSRNAAIFFPRVIQSDPMREGQLDVFVPCGLIAGVMARTDRTRGIWKAPAGLDASLNGIAGLQVNLTDDENGALNPLGINCLRSFPVAGRVIWGTRTLRGADQLADEYKYIAVRRVALYIEESLYRGTQWVVFEPNDEPLWAQIRLNVGSFMHSLFRQGAFQGKSPREAYFVKCDRETTTQDDINKGIVNILVGFAPLKPAEFVVIKIQQMAGQIET